MGRWLRFLLDRLEFKTLALMLAAGAAVWTFLEIADDMAEGDAHAFDERLLLSLRTAGDPSDPIGPGWFEEAMRDVTALGGFTLLTLFVIIAAACLLFYRHHRGAIVLVVTTVLALVTSESLKVLYGRVRPDLTPHDSYVYSHSFPSGHATLAAASFLTLAAILSAMERRRRVKAFIFAIAILVTVGVGLSRLYLGVHWPSDVVAGWTVGAAWAIAARVAIAFWRGPGPAEVDDA